jgi:hypothetical protein
MDSILKMAAFVALEIAHRDSVEAGQSWLASVIDAPEEWQLEADIFEMMTTGPGQRYTYEQAGRAIYELMGKGRKDA